MNERLDNLQGKKKEVEVKDEQIEEVEDKEDKEA